MPSVLLFLGLPLDVRETDLAELLTSDPTRLLPSSIQVTALYNSAGTFLGTFLVEVGSDVDAEKVRHHYSGQIIDGSHTLAVHHVLAPNTPHPAVAPPAAKQPPVIKPMQSTQQQQQHHQKANAAPKREDTRTPGLKLLSRMGKAGKAGEKEKQQKLLIEKQRAALKKAKGNPGDVLLSRLAKNKPAKKAAPAAAATRGAAAAGGANKKKKAVGGKDKVARAKRDSGRMDVDKAPAAAAASAAPAKEKPKTQAQLDEEMKAYERQRRFAAA